MRPRGHALARRASHRVQAVDGTSTSRHPLGEAAGTVKPRDLPFSVLILRATPGLTRGVPLSLRGSRRGAAKSISELLSSIGLFGTGAPALGPG